MKFVQRSAWADAGLHCLWFIAVILLSFGLEWATGSIRAGNDLAVVNRVLAENGGKLTVLGAEGRSPLSGKHYKLSDGRSTAILFTLSAQSVNACFVAVYNPDRGIQKVFPVDGVSRESALRLPAGLLEIKLASLVRSERVE